MPSPSPIHSPFCLHGRHFLFLPFWESGLFFFGVFAESANALIILQTNIILRYKFLLAKMPPVKHYSSSEVNQYELSSRLLSLTENNTSYTLTQINGQRIYRKAPHAWSGPEPSRNCEVSSIQIGIFELAAICWAVWTWVLICEVLARYYGTPSYTLWLCKCIPLNSVSGPLFTE